ncbi:LuxR C-terminal-related transcriptional regulator [Streptomyces sp. NBC_00454]|uniref:helix-turn-helix transcriptional regulator n=1 Tax=Streptomyces sp. NBC_00454 TaxID=2975747 RepID=UPI0030DF9AD7
MCRLTEGDQDSDPERSRSSGEVCDEGVEYYRAAVQKGRAARADAPRCLLELGLLAPAMDDPDSLIPIPPAVATATLAHPVELRILEQQRELAAQRALLSRMEGVYRDVRSDGSEAVQRLTRAPVIAAAVENAVQSAETELLTAHPGGGRPEEVLAQSLKNTLEACRRGVRQRTLYQHTVRTHGPTLDYIKAVTDVGVEVRTVNEVFDRLIICDRSVAFIPDKEREHRDHALKVTDPGIVYFLVSVFEHAWDRAEPIVYEPDQHRPKVLTDETRLHVLRLMVDGYTDAAIASRLGMSTRTVATHLKRMSDLLGSNSRAQLAYLTAQSGLLDGPRPPG